MTKFLIAVVLLITSVKHSAAFSVLHSHIYDLKMTTLLQDEESKKERDEQKKNYSIENEDIIFLHSSNHTLNTSAKALKFSWQKDSYFLQVNDSITPPPDIM